MSPRYLKFKDLEGFKELINAFEEEFFLNGKGLRKPCIHKTFSDLNENFHCLIKVPEREPALMGENWFSYCNRCDQFFNKTMLDALKEENKMINVMFNMLKESTKKGIIPDEKLGEHK